jgi:hypothetical protein
MQGLEGGVDAYGGVQFSVDRLARPSEVHLSPRPRCDRRARRRRRHPPRRRGIRRADPGSAASQWQAVDRGRSKRKRDLRRRCADVDSFHPRGSSDHRWRSAARAAVGLPTRRPAAPNTETSATASADAAGAPQPTAGSTTSQTDAGPPALVTATAAPTAAEAATTAGRHDSVAGGTRLAATRTAAAGTPATPTAAASTLAAGSPGIGVSVHPASTQAGRGRRAGHRRYAKTIAAAPPSAAA